MNINSTRPDIVSLSDLQESGKNKTTRRPACFNVTTRWEGGFKSESTCLPSVIDGHSDLPANRLIYADAPAILGGTNSAPNPQELMLAAFNACLSAAYVAAASYAQVTLEKLWIQTFGTMDLNGFLNRDKNVFPGRESIRYVITVKGSGSKEQFERIHQAVIASSPNRWIIGGNMTIEGDQIVEL